MTEYVMGLYFDLARHYVWLLKKDRPAWQKGRLNGCGGKIEPGETGYATMRREAREELGIDVEDWEPFCVLSGVDWTVTVYRAFGNLVPTQRESEEVVQARVDGVRMGGRGFIGNIPWLVSMALDEDAIEQYTVSAVIDLPG